MYLISGFPVSPAGSAEALVRCGGKIASFHLNAACFFTKKHETQKYHLVRAEPSFTVKTIDWVHQTGPRKGA